MSAIDDLRSLLDERGVKWRTDISVTNKVEWTIWKSPWFKEVWAKEVDGSISIFSCSMTPEQAIEATLGRGECVMGVERTFDRIDGDEEYLLECSECGEKRWWLAHMMPSYCPNCGRKVRA